MHQPLLVPMPPPWLSRAQDALTLYRVLEDRQLAVHVERPLEEVRDVLDRLVRAKLLVALRPLSLGVSSTTAYGFTVRGAKLYARTTGVPMPRAVHAKRSALTLLHEIAVAEVGLVFRALHARAILTLERFDASRERIGFAQAIAGPKPELVPLVADAFLSVRVQGTRHALLVEVDRGTVSAARVANKAEGYLAWLRAEGPETRFGVRALRVLYVVPNRARLERLRDAVLGVAGRAGTGLFWFTEASNVRIETPERILKPVWSTARKHDPGHAGLFAAPAAPS